MGEALHPLGPPGRAAEGSRPVARSLGEQRARVLPPVTDLYVLLRAGKFLEWLLTNGRSSDAFVKAAADLVLAQDPDEERRHPAARELACALADERASVTPPLRRRQDVDRVDLGRILAVARALRSRERVADHLRTFLRDEVQLGRRGRTEPLATPLDVPLELVDDTVGKEPAIRRAPRLDPDAFDGFCVVDRRAPDAHVRGARRTSRRSGARARRGASVSRRA